MGGKGGKTPMSEPESADSSSDDEQNDSDHEGLDDNLSLKSQVYPDSPPALPVSVGQNGRGPGLPPGKVTASLGSLSATREHHLAAEA